METCYKVPRADQGMTLTENCFGFERSHAARAPRARGKEVGSRHGRTYRKEEDPVKDGVRALYCVLKYGLLRLN
jgi:hypothetical protein